MLRFGYFFVLLCCVVPTVLGLSAVLLASLSFIPSIEMISFNLEGFLGVFTWSGIEKSVLLSVFSALSSTYLAFFVSFAILQASWGGRYWKKIQWCLSPLLSMPHVAFAIGFSFLFSPTGLSVRLLESLTGFTFDEASLPFLIQDANGFGLTLMLAVKEVPFLLFMSISVLQQINIANLIKVSESLGYSQAQSWWKVILPLWFSRMRFALFAVLAYGLSVVDVAMIIGPSNPPTFAVLIWQWFNEPDLLQFPKAAAGAALMLCLAIFLMGLMRSIEWLALRRCNTWQFSGRYLPRLPGKSLFFIVVLISLLILPVILLWSFAQRWRFPELLPSRYSLNFWLQEWASVLNTIEQSLFLALISASVAILFSIIAHEYRLAHRLHLPNAIIAIPMLIPPLSILLGIQVAILSLDVSAYRFWVIWSHVFFAFPYVYLAMDGAWQGYDMRLTRCALSLGKSPLQTWFSIKLPLLLPSIVFAWAIGISVSLAQYLPTLILGAGRVTTLTTEAVALSSGFDRRITAIYALWQALLPCIFFFFAIAVQFWQNKLRRKNLKSLVKNDALSEKPHPL